jgi:Zn-dependent protease
MDFNIEQILYTLPGVILGLGLHEWAHAFTAWKLGDITAKEEGRVSLNPLRHLDFLGLFFIVIAGFGWAKPVRFNPENLRHPRRDRMLIALAGPLTNLLLGIGVLCLLQLVIYLIPHYGPRLPPEILKGFLSILLYAASVNLGLFIFNILPIPPLDGSHIFFSSLRLDAQTENRILRIGTIALFAIIIIENRTNANILPIHFFVEKVFGLFGFF